VEEEQRRRVAFEARLEPVDLEDFDDAAANRRAADLRLARLAADLDAHRVRMHVAEVLLGKGNVDAHLLGDANGLGDARIVNVESDRTADQREVRAVAAIRVRERRMQIEMYGDRVFVEDLARHTAEA